MKSLKLGVFTITVMLTSSAHAFLGFGDTKVKVSYPCLGLDGVPIADAALAAQCCGSSGNLNSNLSDQCRTSLYGAGVTEATAGAVSSISVAQKTMEVAKSMMGDASDYSGSTESPIVAKNAAGTSGTSSSALTADLSAIGAQGNGGLGLNGSGQAGGGLSATGTGAGRGSGGGAGSGGSMGLGTAGSTATQKNSDDSNALKAADAGGAYAAVNSDGSGGGTKNGKVGGLFGALFGGNGEAGSGGSADAQFGSGLGADGSGLSGQNRGEGSSGITEDPSDYFKRIDKSASIFKVVSNRYSKETEKKHVLIPAITH